MQFNKLDVTLSLHNNIKMPLTYLYYTNNEQEINLFLCNNHANF